MNFSYNVFSDKKQINGKYKYEGIDSKGNLKFAFSNKYKIIIDCKDPSKILLCDYFNVNNVHYKIGDKNLRIIKTPV